MSVRPAKDPAFSGLGRQIERFANHSLRLVEASQKHRPALERASASTDGAAPLDRRPESPHVALKAIDQFARIHRQARATLFGAYFAHHHLRGQAELSRELMRHALERNVVARASALRRIHALAEKDRRAWISALLERCISAACPDLAPDDYAIFNVGALTDHEDVDLAIVCASIDARQTLDRGFGLVAKTFLRFASKLQLFLAEQLPGSASGGLIEDYELFVEQPVRAVVVVMQMLGAQHLAGSRDLARAFKERITERFYAGVGDPLAHEVFLRSVARELRHYHRGERLTELLAPKREIYLPAKLITAAMRCVHGIHEAYPPDALDLLADRDRPRAATYHALRDVFAANEVLRGLLFWHVSKSDEVDLYDPNIRRAARRVSILFGLCAEGRREIDRLLPTAFQEMRAEALANVLELAHTLDDHLRSASTFRRLIDTNLALAASSENVALRFADALDRLESETDRAEAVELLAGSQALTARLLSDLAGLPEAARNVTARRLVRLLAVDPPALLEFLILAGSLDDGTWRFWGALLEVLDDPDQLERFVERLDAHADPEAFLRLAYAHPAPQLSALADLIAERTPPRHGPAVLRALRAVIVLVHHQSNALARVSSRVLARTPEFIERLLDFERLRGLARDLVTMASREPNSREQIELLGDAFDVQVLRSALAGLLEGAPADRDREWTASFDQHVLELIRVASSQTGVTFDPVAPGSGLALYATGGVGRGEAFAADWDYLALVDVEDLSRRDPLGKLLQRLEGALVRRGVVPHNRLTQRFASYVVSIGALGEHLDHRGPETFIDEAEILEARFMLGDPLVKARFEQEILPRVFLQNAAAFTRDVLAELRALRQGTLQGLRIKEGPGGLREIHLLGLLLRVHAGDVAAEDLLPEHRSDLRFLAVARAELRRIRDVYRLVVALDEPIDPAAMVEVAQDLSPLRDAGVREGFEREIRKLMEASAQRIDRIARSIETRAQLCS